MAPTVPTEWPAAITAGLTTKLLRSFSDYPPSEGWTLTVYLAGTSTLTVAATVSGTAYSVVLSSTATAPLLPGIYSVQELMAKGGETYLAGEARVEVEPNITTATAGSMQSWYEKTLAVLQASISGSVTADIQAYTIGTRTVSKIPLKEKMALMSWCESKIAASKRPGSFGAEVQVQFTGTTPPNTSWGRS